MDTLSFIADILPKLLFGFPAQRPGGLILSLILGGGAALAGLLLAVPIGAARTAQRWYLRWPARLFIETIRGLPLVFLIVVIHSYGSRAIIGRDLTPLASACLALVLFTTAYQAEIVRAGLAAIPRVQREAAHATGLRQPDVLRFIELPQAMRLMWPAFIGQAISLFKDTSVVLVLGVADLMTVTKAIANAGNADRFLLIYGLAGLLYFVAALTFSRIARRYLSIQQNRKLLWLALES